MYPTTHSIQTHVVMYPVHGEFLVSAWGVSGQRASFTFEDNGRRAVRGLKPHPVIDLELDFPRDVYQLRATLWQALEQLTKNSDN